VQFSDELKFSGMIALSFSAAAFATKDRILREKSNYQRLVFCRVYSARQALENCYEGFFEE
jgi:hypothetical protein